MTNWTGSLAWDGDNLWVSENSYLHERDPETGAQLSYFPTAYSAQTGGVAWDGEVFYYGSDMNNAGTQGDGLIHVYMPDGTETGTLTTPGGSDSPSGLAYDGENLWVTIDEGDTLYCVHPGNGSVNWTVPYSETHGDLTVRDGYLWIVTYGAPPELTKIVP
ncbi:MAG: PQQ-binding-like beta-propeller repeat protein [Candidatus Eisenbacteria bacterium]|nr:PQQ-binding-like beta-propeller repeat protein [Candidatus Eisenbacteria bacterium]